MESPIGWLAAVSGPRDRERRAGSYAPNSWMRPLAWQDHEMEQERFTNRFRLDADIESPSGTPVFTDGSFWWHALVPGGSMGLGSVGPRADDLPPPNLATGGPPGAPWGMGTLALPRHGSRPARFSTNHPPSAPLPGAINAAFFDGHVETAKLDRLWQLTWHRDYRAPNKRPMLR